MKKKILILPFIVVLGLFLAGGTDAQSCEYHNVWGWAWSDNIGWISFSCKDVTGTIDRIRVRMRFQGTIKTYFRLNGAESKFPGEGSAGGAWADRFTAWMPSRPGGGSWTWDDIKNLQVVAGLSTWTFSGKTYQGRLTQIYVEVDDGGSILTLRPDSDGDYINIENPPVGSHWDLVDDVVADDFGTYVWTDSGSEQKDAYNLQDPLAAGSTVNYGVDINETTGEFSGYAWSDNIGWISFNSGDLAGCPSAPCEARLDLDGTTCGAVGQVCGWARALAYGGGWDGWIKLRDSSYGVSLNPAPTPSEFREWAWGSDVIGWISFNCLDTGACGVSDYKVMTDITITLNNIPSATNLSREQTSGCGSAPIVRFSWNYSDDDNVPPGTDPQSAYEIQIDDDSNLDEDPIATLSGGASTSRDYSPPSFGTTYWWRVRVRDTNGPAWSGWTDGPNFTPTKWPDPDFIWCPLEPDINETIQFCSVFEAGVCDQAAEPSCSDMTGSADNLTTCAAGCNLWEWDFDNDGTPEITSTDNPTYSYSSSGDYRVRLTVTDADGHSCFKLHDVSADIPLPIWKEIPPF